VLARIESGAVVAPGEQERMTEEASAVAHLLDLLDSSADDRFSRPGGIHKLAGRKGPGTGKMSRMEMEQESGCVRDAASRSTPLIRMSSTGSRDVGSGRWAACK
jgi:hypothetical protein